MAIERRGEKIRKKKRCDGKSKIININFSEWGSMRSIEIGKIKIVRIQKTKTSFFIL